MIPFSPSSSAIPMAANNPNPAHTNATATTGRHHGGAGLGSAAGRSNRPKIATMPSVTTVSTANQTGLVNHQNELSG